MKLVTFANEGGISVGILVDGTLIDIRRAWPAGPRNMLEILRLGEACMDKLTAIAETSGPRERLALDGVRLLAPVTRPGKVLALAGNYAEHIKEAGHEKGFKLGLSDSPRDTTTPRPFLMPSTAITGDGEVISWPAYSRQVDYELELAIVIGRWCKCVSASESLEFVAGYTVANDVSARSVTFKEGRGQRPWDEFYDWLNGKWADGFCPMGPVLVTADEIADVQNLKMELRVNGQVRQSANTSQMIYGVADVVSFMSHLMTLEPGDVICTGTPSGVGVATGDFLKAGDLIEGQIEGIGKLTNTMGDEPERFYEPLSK